jgi:hypothetical protein
MYSSDEHAVCRGCGLVLKGKPYWAGGQAYHPRTGKQCPANHFGGYVCSEQCDYRACLEQERSMPGHGDKQMSVGSYCRESIQRNWPATR